MFTVLLQIRSKSQKNDRQFFADFKSEKQLKKEVERLSMYPDVENISVIPFERKNVSYNEYLKEYFL